MSTLRCLVLLLASMALAGCVSMEPGVARNLTGSRRTMKAETLAAKPHVIALINNLPPVLYINNAEGNVWAGKSAFVAAPELAGLNTLVDENVAARLKAVLGDVEVRRLTWLQARDAKDVDWIIQMDPNGFVVPDFSWGAFAKVVLVGSAEMAAGVPAPVMVARPHGDPALAAGRADRPAYTLGTNPIYGTIVSINIAWKTYHGTTWVELAHADMMSNILLHAGKIAKPWDQWSTEQQHSVWRDLQSAAPAAIAAHLSAMGIGK